MPKSVWPKKRRDRREIGSRSRQNRGVAPKQPAGAQDSADHQAHMLRASLRRTAAATAPLRTLRRNLNLHEYQAAALMAEKGVNVPFGLPATTVEEAVAAAATIGDEQVVIKSQILVGRSGRSQAVCGPLSGFLPEGGALEPR